MHTEQTYKNSPLGLIPSDWEVKELEKVAEIDRNSLKSNTSPDYTFEYISLSDVDSEDFKMETTLQTFRTAPSRARRIVKKGDVLLSTVRPNLQGFTIIRNDVKDLIASTGFAVISSKDCYFEYLFHFLFSLYTQKQFYQLLVGSNYPAINSSDVRKLKILLPPLPEQKAIAKVLGTWDEAISKMQALIAQKELQKKYLMQNLLTGKKRLKGFVGEWKDIELGELLEYEQPTKYLVNDTQYNDSYSIPVLTAGKTFILGYTNEKDGICQELPVIIFDDFTTASKFIDFPFKVKSSAMKLLRAKPNANLKYVYESMQLLKYTVGGHQRHWISKFVYLTIPCPPIEEQTAIAKVLEASDKEISLLKQQLEALKTQKKGLMQVLLTGKKRLKGI